MKLARIYFKFITVVLAITAFFVALTFSNLTPKTNAVAGINRTINFQGKLVNNPAKTNVSNTSYTVVFTIYDRTSGGTALWSETQTVNTSDGIFRVALGSVTPFPANFNFNWDGLYLGMKVNADAEMSPRIQLAAVPFAFNAEKVAGLTVQDDAGNASTSATLRIANDKTVTISNGLTFSGADSKTINFGSNNLTFTTSADTAITLPTSGTLATLAGNEILTNKSIGSTGLTFSGATTDITTGANEDLTLSPNGTGNLILAADSDTGVTIGNSSGNKFPLLVRLGIGNNAAFAIDNLNNGDLLAASSSGITKFVIKNDGTASSSAGFTIDGTGSLQTTKAQTLTVGGSATGNILLQPNGDIANKLQLTSNGSALTLKTTSASNLNLDTGGAAALNLGSTNATTIVAGSSALSSFTVNTAGTGDSTVVLPAQSIGATEILNDTIDYSKISNTPTLDADTTTSFSTFSQIFDLTSVGDFLIRDAGNNFAQFLDDGTITLGKSASASTLNLGTGAGADTISIGSNNTVGDTLVIGNNNSSTTLSVTGGNSWSISSAGAANFASITGAGLSNCNAAGSKLLYTSASGTFSCGVDLGATLQVANFTDTTSDTLNDSAQDLWDGTQANITPGDSSSKIVVAVTVKVLAAAADDENNVFRLYRNIGSNATCSSTQVGPEFGTFSTQTGAVQTAALTFTDTPSTTSNVRYTVCESTTSVAVTSVNNTTPQIDFTLTEYNSVGGGGSGGNVAVRESDGSPSVASASTLEFGPASTSSDEFIVTDQGSGVARVRLGNQVGLLNQASTVTGGWTFNTSATTFTTGINANGGLNTTSNTNLSLAANGSGNIILSTDSDTGVKIGSTLNSPAVLSVSGGIGNNAALIVNNINSGDIISASSSGITKFIVDSNGNLGLSGGVNLSTGNLAFSSTGGINLAGGNISDSVGDVLINDNLSVSGTTGITFTSTGGINLAGGNISDSTGPVSVNDDLSVSGTLTAGTWDGLGATALNIGSNDITSLSVTTDGTGDSEVVLPDESIGSNEITNDSLTPTDFAPTLTFSDGDLLDLSSILHDDSTPQGFKLPQNSSLTSPSSGEGYLAYNTSSHLVQVFDGSNWVSIAGGNATFDSVYSDSVGASDTTLDINDSSGLTFNLASTGNFLIQDSGSTFAEFLNDGTINLGSATLDGTINIGAGTGIDTINIGTGATGADVISIGNSAGTVAITGSNFDLSSAGILTMGDKLILSSLSGEGITGGGLVNCDGATDKLQWSSATNQFSCGTDSNITAVFDAYDATGGDNIGSGVTVNLDTTRKNSDGSVYSLSGDVLTINQTGTYTFQYRVSATLTAGTRGAIRAYMEEDTGSGFSEVPGTRAYAYGRITTYPEATAVGFITMDVTAGDQFRVRSLVEAGTFSTVADGSSLVVSKVGDSTLGGGGGGIDGINVRESDGSPTVSTATTVEFGPASTSTDEFIVSDEGSGVARVRIGNMVGMLNEAETVTGGWTFNTTQTTFNSLVHANTGIDTSTSNTNLSLGANGTGNIVLNTDSDTGVYVGTSSNTPAVLSVTGGYGSNAAFILDQLNDGDIFSASSSGSTKFVLDNGGNISLSGGVNLSTGNLAFSSTGGINLAGGSISDSVGDVLINDNLSISGSSGITFTSTGGINLAGGNISDSTGPVSVNDDLTTSGNLSVSGATGLTLSGTGADLIFANGESLTNDTNSVFTFKRNDAGTVTINAADNDSTAALAINSGGAAALSLDTGGAAALSIGTANANSITIGNTGSGVGLTLDSGSGGINIGDSATTKAIEIGGVDNNGSDSIRIATNATSPDTINIGNANSSTTMALTGGTAWSINSSGNVTGAAASFTTGNFSDQITASNNGIEFTESDTNPTCASGNYTIYADTSDGRLKKCQNGTVSDLAQDVDVINRAKSADQSVTNSTTLADETALQFTIGAGEEWNVYWNLSVTNNNSATPDLKMAIQGPTGVTCRVSMSGSEPAGAAFPEVTSTDCTTPGTLVDNTIVADANVPFPVNIIANIQAGGTGGAVKLRFAENTGGVGTSLTIKEGSIMNAYRVTGADLAEIYYTDDSTIKAGDVVSLDPTKNAGVIKSAGKYDAKLFGIVSTKPGLVLSNSSNGDGYPVLVALAGRVPVKVSTENGEIKAGDHLTSSSIPGVAMKATKSGQVIGMAMQDYKNDGVGSIMAIVRSGNYTGNIEELFTNPNIHFESDTFARDALKELVSSDENQGLTGSNIVTDRLIASIEIVTPKMTVDTLEVNNLKAAHIDGLEMINDRLAALEDKVATISANLESSDSAKIDQQNKLMELITSQLASATKSSTMTQDSASVDSINVGTSTSSGSLRIKGNALVEGILNVVDTLTSNNLIVNSLATFFGDAVFKAKVAFEGPVTFGNDAGGNAVITKGTDRVEIVFDSEFEENPIINASVTFDEKKDKDGNIIPSDEVEKAFFKQNYSYIVVNKSQKGFTIVLNKKATDDVTFTWTAMRVKDAKTIQSRLTSP